MGQQQPRHHRAGGKQAPHPEADAHNVHPLGLLQVGVPHVGPAFHQPVPGIQEDDPPLLGGIGVHKGKGHAACPGQRHRQVAAEQIGAVGVLAAQIAHLEGAHAEAGGAQGHVGDGHGGGQQAVGLHARQRGDQQVHHRLAHIEQQAARRVENKVSLKLTVHPVTSQRGGCGLSSPGSDFWGCRPFPHSRRCAGQNPPAPCGRRIPFWAADAAQTGYAPPTAQRISAS